LTYPMEGVFLGFLSFSGILRVFLGFSSFSGILDTLCS
jgi:hypothetical protein